MLVTEETSALLVEARESKYAFEERISKCR